MSICNSETRWKRFGQKEEKNPFSFQLESFGDKHCVKSVQIRSFFWSVFSCIRNSVQIQENTDQKKLRIWTLFTQYPCNKINDFATTTIFYLF